MATKPTNRKCLELIPAFPDLLKLCLEPELAAGVGLWQPFENIFKDRGMRFPGM